MKKFSALLAVVLGFSATAQITTIPDQNIDPADTLEIIFDPSELDLSIGHHALLKQAIDSGQSMYIWTWKPAAHPDGHPFANGTGSAPWKNSNDTLRLTANSNGTFSWKIVPTLWYEVDAITVYAEDIHFLIKAKDGGGYGDPDVKTDDQLIRIDPPATERNPFYQFPTSIYADDLLTLRYENWREEKASMQNLDSNDCFAYSKVTYTDGSVDQIENSFNVGTNPELQMTWMGDGNFEMQIIPNEHFSFDSSKTVDFLEFVVQKRAFASGADRVTEALIVPIECP